MSLAWLDLIECNRQHKRHDASAKEVFQVLNQEWRKIEDVVHELLVVLAGTRVGRYTLAHILRCTWFCLVLRRSLSAKRPQVSALRTASPYSRLCSGPISSFPRDRDSDTDTESKHDVQACCITC